MPSSCPMKVLCFPSYPIRDASSRHRIYNYKEPLERLGYIIDISTSSSEFLFNLFYKILLRRPKNKFRAWSYKMLRAVYYFLVFIKRFVVISLCSSNYDVIFIHRSLVPNGIGYLEKRLQKYNHNILFDFDDAIFEFPRNKKSMPAFLGQVNHIIAGNPFLKKYAVQFNANVHEIPTCLKLTDLKNETQDKNKDIILGWIGSPTNLKHLELIKNSIKKIMKKHSTVKFWIICDSQEYSIDHSVDNRVEGIRWNLEKEIDMINSIDIGLMPLYEDDYSKGKCGFKLIQYMSMGKAVVCSPVGINADIVEHNINGFHASTDEEWELYIDKLISNAAERKNMGKNGRKKMEKYFSLDICLKKLDLILKEMESSRRQLKG